MAVKVINKKQQTIFGGLDSREYFMFEGDLFLKIDKVKDDETGDYFNAIHLESGIFDYFYMDDEILKVNDIEITIK